ncbi:MAG: aminotransferase class IV [Bacillota bacterium]
MYISVNGKLIDSKEPCISPVHEGYMYGYGLFETIKVSEGRPVFLKEHIDRLLDGCQRIKLKETDFLYNIEALGCELLQANNIQTGVLRVLYAKDTDEHYHLVISTREFAYDEEKYKKGFQLCFSSIKRNPDSLLVYVKSNNYLENMLARQGAREKGFDEVVFLNCYGNVCEGTISNIFFVKEGRLYTPSVDCGILPGIMRKKVMDLGRKMGLSVKTGEYEKKCLLEADEIFITNSLMEIMPVSKLDDKIFDLEHNTMTRLLINGFKNLE